MRELRGKLKHTAKTPRRVVNDFRNSPQSGIDNPCFYAELLNQAVWFEGLGLGLKANGTGLAAPLFTIVTGR